MKQYHILGLMSGSSLDGLDIAYCQFTWKNASIADWKILVAETAPFSEMWQARLQALPAQNALILAKTNTYFGYYMGELVNAFVRKHNISNLDAIASHGHTVFHQPSKRFTLQIGSGAALAATTQQTVICDFRAQDVALDGEGAPLAPIADQYLFAGYDFYLNLGGIANIGAVLPSKTLGFDVCYANQILNTLAVELGKPYDEGGHWAKAGNVQADLLEKLTELEYFRQDYPKSLGNEWIRQHILPLYMEHSASWQDKLATATHHIASEIAQSVVQIIEKEQLIAFNYRLLVTGGGAFNTHLITQLAQQLREKQYPTIELIVPDAYTIQFKEAALMALLGLLRLERQPNTLPACTGAKYPTIAGAIYI